MEFCFHIILGVDLEQVWHVKSWRWFTTRIKGLLMTESPLSRHFAPEEEPPEVAHA